ncbi:MAG: CehA/McbA family metallohydrolase [Verrucomicrobia bacterium]|nr:CehA/McbA family metallohydrolase [Verrucomicrobiota bacterium]
MRAEKLPFFRDHFVCTGKVQLDLSPGNYSYEIERGPEYLVRTGSVIVTAAATQNLALRLERLVDMAAEGWWSGDLHVHRPVKDIELLMWAEDLHVAPVMTWWNAKNEWSKRKPPADLMVQFDGNRFYHVMAGEDEREGGALLYFNLKEPLPIASAAREYPSPMKFLKDARQNTGVWVDIEKPFWWDVPVWLASGQVDSIGLANNHMCRDQMYESEAWGKPRDKERLPPPRGNGFWTQEIYYHILNCGLRIPPSAGSASGVLPNPVGYDRVYVQVGPDLTYEKWWEGLRAGRSFVSNGPLLRCKANDQWPGHVFKVKSQLDIEVEAALNTRDPILAIEIIKNGRVDRAVPFEQWKRTGKLGKMKFTESGWFLVRAITDNPKTFRFASTAPFYVEIGERKRLISRESAQFFLDWVRERMSRIKLDDAKQREEVLAYHRMAEKFWQEKVEKANAR